MTSLSNWVDDSAEIFRVGKKHFINRMTTHPHFCMELRGFLERSTFSVKTKKVLGNQDELIIPDINPEFILSLSIGDLCRAIRKAV